MRRVVQVVLDALGDRPIETVRILDLACLEGLYALEFARRGAQVVAIDGREANVAKVDFVKDALRLGTLQVDIDDVRHLSREKLQGPIAKMRKGLARFKRWLGR